MDSLPEFLAHFPQFRDQHDRLSRYFTYAQQQHQGQVKLPRQEPYFDHVLRVTLLLEEFDLELIIAALLHDVVEKSNTTLEELEKLADPTIAHLVKGVTKTEEQKNIITLLRVTADQDHRVITLRLADRLDNLRYSYPHMDDQRRTKYREETPKLLELAETYGINAFTAEIRTELGL